VDITLLTRGVSLLRGRLDARALTWVNRASGMTIAAFGVLALLGAASTHLM
jgi:hypothetical protein